MQNRKFGIFLFLLPAILLFACIFAYPLCMVVSTSFFEWKGLSGKMVWNGLENFRHMFTADHTFLRSLWNTVIWVVLQSTVHVAIGTCIALLLSRKPFGWKAVRTVYMFPNIISVAVLGIVYLNFFNPKYGLINSVIRAFASKDFNMNWYFDSRTSFGTVTSTWLLFAGLVTILVLAEIAGIPDDLFEAAKIDGASRMQVDRYIMLPLLRNVLGTCVILSSTSMLKEFELIFLTTNGGPDILTMNLPLMVYKTSLIESNFGYANAIGTFTILLGILLITASTRLFRIGESDR